MDRGELVAGDQAMGLGTGPRRVALHVGDDQVELCAAERLDAAGVIYHLDRELRGDDASLADLGHAAGGGIEPADVDRIRGPASQHIGAEGSSGDRAACDLAEKISTLLFHHLLLSAAIIPAPGLLVRRTVYNIAHQP